MISSMQISSDLRGPRVLNTFPYRVGAPPAQGDAPASFFVLYLFPLGSAGRIFAAVGAGNVATVSGAELETMPAGRGKPAAFPSGREYLFSIGGAAVFHISIRGITVHCFSRGITSYIVSYC